MDIFVWQKNKPWMNIVSGLRTFKNMIQPSDPDSDGVSMFGDFDNSNPASFKDQEREAHRGEEVFDLADAQVVTSESLANPFIHKVLIDIDHPAVLVPSSTEGHYHLLIDVEVPWEKYVDFMDAAAEAGILEKGFVSAARARGFSTLRMPWIKKTKEEIERKKRRPGRRPSGTGPVHEQWLQSVNGGDMAQADRLYIQMARETIPPVEQRSASVLDRLFPEPRRERLGDSNEGPFSSLDDSYEEVQGMMLARGIEAGPPIIDEAMRLSDLPRITPQQFYDALHRPDPFVDHNETNIPIENHEESF